MMDGLQIFILCLFIIIALGNAHVRYTRYRIIRDLQEEGKSAEEIAKIMKAYKED